MKYRRRDAKAYAREHFKGIWAAALTPFAPDLAIAEAGLRRNFRHWVDDLGIDGVFVSGKQGEFFSMSVAERKTCGLKQAALASEASSQRGDSMVRAPSARSSAA